MRAASRSCFFFVAPTFFFLRCFFCDSSSPGCDAPDSEPLSSLSSPSLRSWTPSPMSAPSCDSGSKPTEPSSASRSSMAARMDASRSSRSSRSRRSASKAPRGRRYSGLDASTATSSAASTLSSSSSRSSGAAASSTSLSAFAMDFMLSWFISWPQSTYSTLQTVPPALAAFDAVGARDTLALSSASGARSGGTKRPLRAWSRIMGLAMRFSTGRVSSWWSNPRSWAMTPWGPVDDAKFRDWIWSPASLSPISTASRDVQKSRSAGSRPLSRM
mmetsp:Transcript_1881/g.5953  ORF Transcript_1881/g.5953 Transcript_1881/m.5953 type:complete len:273 (-) Transcript_1881:567-1385(-)